MGCGLTHPTHIAPSAATVNRSAPPPCKLVERKNVDASQCIDEGPYQTPWAEGLFSDEIKCCPILKYQDYKGVSVTVTNNVSKSKTNKICAWIDQAVEAHNERGDDTLYNPNDVNAWPEDLMDMFSNGGRLAPQAVKDVQPPKEKL